MNITLPQFFTFVTGTEGVALTNGDSAAVTFTNYTNGANPVLAWNLSEPGLILNQSTGYFWFYAISNATNSIAGETAYGDFGMIVRAFNGSDSADDINETNLTSTIWGRTVVYPVETDSANYYTTDTFVSNLSVTPGQEFTFNLTVNNTRTWSEENITQVNITVPSGVTLSSNISFSSSLSIDFFQFADGSDWISFDNFTDGMVMNSTAQWFWFNATIGAPGIYNFTVRTMNKTASVEEENITIYVNSTAPPDVMLENWTTPADSGWNFSGWVNFSVNISYWPTLYHEIQNVSIKIVNQADGTTMNFSLSSEFNETYLENANGHEWNITLNTSEFPDGIYDINLSVNATNGDDFYQLINETTIVTSIIFDNTAPSLSYTCQDTNLNEGGSMTCACTVTDALSGENTTATTYSSSVYGSTGGSHTVTCSTEDWAGNANSTTFTYNVLSSSGNKGSSPGTATTTTWTSTIKENDVELSEKGEVTQELGTKTRVQVKVDSATHYVGVKSLTSTTATIEVASTPQEATLSVGDTRKFEITGDNKYDLEVTLNKIESNKADITLKRIYEEITTESEQEQEKQEAEAQKAAEGAITSNLLWLWILLAVVVVVVIGFLIYRKKR